MTQQDLGQSLGHSRDDSPQPGSEPGPWLGTAADEDSSGALGSLFDSSPARSVQTSGAAVTGFVLGLLAAATVPFSLTLAASTGMAAVALIASIVGMARASRPTVSGGLLASVGLVLALATLALFGLRYIGLDIAFGDGFVPTLHDGLDWLNGLLPQP
jgi:hypothetical protein